jgi:hypothetical protein
MPKQPKTKKLTNERAHDSFKVNLMVLLIKRGGGIWPLEASAADFMY